MILNITEQQKKVIESRGYMVIQFKAWVKRFFEWFNKWSSQVIDTWKLIISFLKQKVRECSLALHEFAICIKEKLEPLIELMNSINKERADYEPRRKYPFVRSIGRKYELRYRQAVYLHRCRNNC